MFESEEQRFAKAFAEAWAAPTPERLTALLHPAVVLYQPHRRPIRSATAALTEFRRLLAWLPKLHGEVDAACGEDGRLFIEWRMKLPLGKSEVVIHAVDRFRLEAGLGIERAVYFDQMVLIRAVLKHPRLWWGFLKYRFGPEPPEPKLPPSQRRQPPVL
ncbi:nuclear transport factor 2 family protein [Sinimarinibacterium sp. CAU 1509]|uniref:nuclear transport factor 2 family protein n=1 Tax=Sinimarinibacterium sp. CAU 1509 TaxID=2562283 RepID=UPI00146D475B|nr:nuclear transport factor 2 family protein [Sinimarinibacterium sp. CAU 1509]